MARQYKRYYDLTVVTTDGIARFIRDLRVSFEITKSILNYPNLCLLNIYNPNQDTLSVLQEKYTRINLNAGYEGNSRLIFAGDVRNVLHRRMGIDRVATVYAGDGEKGWQNAIFNRTFQGSVKLQQVIQEIASTFEGVTIGAIEGVPNVADKLLGQTLSGSSRDILNEFAKQYGFDWSIQDGELTIAPIAAPLSGEDAVLVTAATGLIGSPILTEVGADVVTLLNPRLLPYRVFTIDSPDTSTNIGNLFFRGAPRTDAVGSYKIEEVVFKGDSRGGEWFSSVKGRLLNG